MALKTFKPYTPSRRFLTMLDKSEITKESPEKSLTESKKRTGGRNAHGEITSWHRGGGHARRYRAIDFRRDKLGIPAKVAADTAYQSYHSAAVAGTATPAQQAAVSNALNQVNTATNVLTLSKAGK